MSFLLRVEMPFSALALYWKMNVTFILFILSCVVLPFDTCISGMTLMEIEMVIGKQKGPFSLERDILFPSSCSLSQLKNSGDLFQRNYKDFA